MEIKYFTDAMLKELVVSGKKLPRKRVHYNIHGEYTDPCQRLFNAIGIDSYIPPHKHSPDSGDECLFAITGLFAIVIFNDLGDIVSSKKFGSEVYCASNECNSMGVQISANTWHTVLALTDSAIMLEVKKGPFNPLQAKEIAPWAPVEYSTQAFSYHQDLKRAITYIDAN